MATAKIWNGSSTSIVLRKCSKLEKKKTRKSDRVTIQFIKLQIEQYFTELFTDLN